MFHSNEMNDYELQIYIQRALNKHWGKSLSAFLLENRQQSLAVQLNELGWLAFNFGEYMKCVRCWAQSRRISAMKSHFIHSFELNQMFSSFFMQFFTDFCFLFIFFCIFSTFFFITNALHFILHDNEIVQKCVFFSSILETESLTKTNQT